MKFPRLKHALYNDIVFLDTPPKFKAKDNFDIFCMDLVNMSLEEVTNLPMGMYRMHFMQEPYVVPVTSRRMLFTWFFWQLFKKYPGAYPRPQSLYTQANDKWFSAKAAKNISSEVFWNVYYGLNDPKFEKIYPLSADLYQAVNDLYNWTTDMLSEYEGGITYHDTYELLTHPKIEKYLEEAKAALKDTSDNEAISKCYDKCVDVILNEPGLEHNEYRRGARTNTYAPRALVQILVMRGSMKEIDGTILPNPILSRFGEGHDTNYYSYTDSISAKRAEMSTKNPLRLAEYSTRKYQQATSRVSYKVIGDCGSTEGIEMVIHPDNFSAYVGLYQILPDGDIQMIQKTDTHLKGQLVKTRSLTNCKNNNPQHPCSTCIGHNARVLDIYENIGHALTVDPCAAFSNALMSVKHLENSAVPTDLIIPTPADKYFSKLPNNSWLLRVTKPKNERAVIKFKVSEALNLSYLQANIPIKELSVTTVTSLKSVVLELGTGKQSRNITLKTTTGTVTSSFTTEFLKYISKRKYTSDGRVFEVNLDEWNEKAPIIQTPRQNVDSTEHLNRIGSFLMKAGKSKLKDGAGRIADCTTVSSAVSSLLELFMPTSESMKNQRMNVHLNQIEIFVLAAKIKSFEEHDYRIPGPGEPYEFSNLISVINNGSFSVKQAFERGREGLMSPYNYIKEPPQPHPFDAMCGAPRD